MEVVSDEKKYLQGLLVEIDRIKARNGHALFRVNDRITRRVAEHIKKYFQQDPAYTIELKRCAQCTHEWDVIITFR